jgi:hypothetical protein
MVDILQRLHQQEVEGGGSSDEGGEDAEDVEEEGGLSNATLHLLLAKVHHWAPEQRIAACLPAHCCYFCAAVAILALLSVLNLLLLPGCTHTSADAGCRRGAGCGRAGLDAL